MGPAIVTSVDAVRAALGYRIERGRRIIAGANEEPVRPKRSTEWFRLARTSYVESYAQTRFGLDRLYEDATKFRRENRALLHRSFSTGAVAYHYERSCEPVTVTLSPADMPRRINDIIDATSAMHRQLHTGVSVVWTHIYFLEDLVRRLDTYPVEPA